MAGSADSNDWGTNRHGAGPWRARRTVVLGLVGLGAVVFAVYNIAALVHESRLDLRFAPRRTISLTEPDGFSGGAPGPVTDDRPALRVAIAPVISPEESLQRYQGMVDYLGEKLGRRPVLLQGGSYEQVNALVQNQQCELALVCTYAYICGQREFGMEALVVPVIGGEDHYHSYIVVPRSSPAQSLLDLRGKRFGSANRLSNSGWLYPMVWLLEHGEDAETFFGGNHVITGSHDRSVLHVEAGYVDGAAVDSVVYDQMVAEDPSVAERTRVLDVSPEFGMPPLVVPRQLDAELRGDLLEVLLGMHEDRAGREVLRPVGIDRFIRPREGLFESVRSQVACWESR